MRFMIHDSRFKNKSGFTLVELMITMSIIAVLSVVLSVSFSRAQKDGRDQRRVDDLKVIQNAAEQYYMLSGNYPSNSTMPWKWPNTASGQMVLQKFPVGPKGGSDTYTYYSNASGFCVCSTNMESGKSIYKNADQINQFPCDFQTNGVNYCVSSQQ